MFTSISTIVLTRLHGDMRELISRTLIVGTDRVRHPTCRDRVSRGNTTVHGAARTAICLLDVVVWMITRRPCVNTIARGTPHSKQTSQTLPHIHIALKYSTHNKTKHSEFVILCNSNYSILNKWHITLSISLNHSIRWIVYHVALNPRMLNKLHLTCL